MLIEIWQVFYHPSKKGSEIVCLKLIMISWHTLLTGVTCMLLNSSRSDIVYGKLCEIKSAIGLKILWSKSRIPSWIFQESSSPPPLGPTLSSPPWGSKESLAVETLTVYGVTVHCEECQKMGLKDQCSRKLELTVKNSERIEAKDSLCLFRLETVKRKMSPQQLFCNKSWMPKENGSI